MVFAIFGFKNVMKQISGYRNRALGTLLAVMHHVRMQQMVLDLAVEHAKGSAWVVQMSFKAEILLSID